MSFSEDDDPLWKRILLNEMVIAGVVILAILIIAFLLATKPSQANDFRP